MTVRFINIPELGDLKLKDLKAIDQKHLGKFCIFEGTIIRVCKAINRELESQVAWNQCGAKYTAASIIEDNNRLKFPTSCTNKVDRKKNPIFEIGRNVFNK